MSTHIPPETDSDPQPMFDPIETESLSSRIQDQILDNIARQRLSAGDRLPGEREMARQLGVGRPVVREAVAALSLMRVVDIHPGKGVFVSGLETDTLIEPIERIFRLNQFSNREMFDVRRALELMSVSLAAERSDDASIDSLRATVHTMSQVEDDPAKLLSLDARYHVGIAHMSGNKVLSEFVAIVNSLAPTTRQRTYAIREWNQRTIEEHNAILDAISAGDASLAVECMTQHLAHASQNLADMDRDRAQV